MRLNPIQGSATLHAFWKMIMQHAPSARAFYQVTDIEIEFSAPICFAFAHPILTSKIELWRYHKLIPRKFKDIPLPGNAISPGPETGGTPPF
jgi:hypothetical protein